jgi:hypothetical protein
MDYLDILHKAADLFFDGALTVDQLLIDDINCIAIQDDLSRVATRLEPFRTKAMPRKRGAFERNEPPHDPKLLAEADLTPERAQEFAALFRSIPDDAYPRSNGALSILKQVQAKDVPPQQLARVTAALAKLEAVAPMKKS